MKFVFIEQEGRGGFSERGKHIKGSNVRREMNMKKKHRQEKL